MRLNLKLLRVKNKMSQEEFSEVLNMKRMTYANIESGRSRGSEDFWRSVQKTFNIPDAEMFSLMKDDSKGE